MNSVYQVNKGVNAPIVFKGLKAQYIWWLGIGLAGLLLLFTVMFILGVPVFLLLTLIFGSGGMLFRWVYRCSKKYGEHGMMKAMAAKSVPDFIKCDYLFK